MNKLNELSSAANLIEYHQRDETEVYQDDKHISSMAINCRYAQRVKITDMPEHELAGIRPFIIPSFCYQNAFDSAKKLNATHIVYGLALNFLGSICISAEHAWLKLSDGRMVDPTYQVDNEQAFLLPETLTYYSLFEIPIKRYAEFAAELDFKYGDHIAMDFMPIRRSETHRFLFR